jgi:hypothetical protein
MAKKFLWLHTCVSDLLIKYIKLSGTLIMYQTIFFQVRPLFVHTLRKSCLVISQLIVNTVVIIRPM